MLISTFAEGTRATCTYLGDHQPFMSVSPLLPRPARSRFAVAEPVIAGTNWNVPGSSLSGAPAG